MLTKSRVVHAKAAGSRGEFEVTHDITDITSAAFLSEVGKKTPFLVRISTVGPERGSADTVRDVRGWAMKFFTEEGNQDWVFNDIVRSHFKRGSAALIFLACFLRQRSYQVSICK